MDLHDIFLVFVEGREDNQDAYAAWFGGTHMADMERLPAVFSAIAYRLASLDGQDVPAQFCAIYETGDGPGILTTIAEAKGTDALPASDVQGRMIWRVLEGRKARDFGGAASATNELICLFGQPFDDDAEDRLWKWLSENSEGIAAVRQLRLSSAQPSRGSEFGSFLFVTLEPSADPAKLASAICDVRDAAASRFLLARPIG